MLGEMKTPEEEFRSVLARVAELLQLVTNAENSAQQAKLELAAKDLSITLREFEASLRALPGAKRGKEEQEAELNQVRKRTSEVKQLLANVCALENEIL